MKKSIWIYILALVLGLTLLCGCGDNVDTSTETSTETETETLDTSTDTETVDSSTETETDTESDTESDTETETNTEKMEEPEIKPHVHTIGYTSAKLATCTEDGYTEGRMCASCKEVIVPYVKIPALGHKWVGIKRTEPTCTTSGLTEGVKCEKCGEVTLKQEYIAPLGHDVIIIPAIQSTCKRNGYTEGMECRRCRKVFVEREKLPLTDHKYIVHMPKEPTCTEAGNNLYQSCSVCSYEKNYEKILPLGHNYNKDYVCTICNKDATTIQGLTFVLNEQTNEYTLSDVQNPELVTIFYEGVELNYPRIVIPDTYNGLPVTSIAKKAIFLGTPWCNTLLELEIPKSVTYICQYAIYNQAITDIFYGGDVEDWCNITFEDVPLWGEGAYTLRFNGEIASEITIPASVTEIGKHQFSQCCSIKKIIISDGGVTKIDRSALGRSLVEIELSKSVTEIIGCLGFEKINYLGTIEDWLNIDMSNSGLVEISYNRELYINGELLTEVVIPASVTEIKKGAFSYVTSIESVVISEGVTKIWTSAFEKCRNLKSVTIPASVTEIGANPIYGASNFEINYLGTTSEWCNINFGGGYYWLDGVQLYIGGELLTDVIIPSSVTKVKNYAFAGYKHLNSVVFENGATEIGAYAFKQCVNLKSVKLPQTLLAIENSAFSYCTSLKDVEIPNGVTKIGDSAFEHCSFASLILPSSVLEIGSGAFCENSQLLVVVIPKSVTKVGTHAFYKCVNVRIYCEATKCPIGWSPVWNGESCYYWYSQTKPETEGNYWVYIGGDIYVW